MIGAILFWVVVMIALVYFVGMASLKKALSTTRKMTVSVSRNIVDSYSKGMEVATKYSDEKSIFDRIKEGLKEEKEEEKKS